MEERDRSSKNTDKYYKSKQTSIVSNVSGDRRTSPDGAVKPGPVFNVAASDRNADKYYRNGGSVLPAKGTKPSKSAGSKSVPTLEKKERTEKAIGSSKMKMVDAGDNKTDVRAAVEKIVYLVRDGHTVRVTVVSGMILLLRTLLDYQVSREIITKEQYNLIKVELVTDQTEKQADEFFGKPELMHNSVDAKINKIVNEELSEEDDDEDDELLNQAVAAASEKNVNVITLEDDDEEDEEDEEDNDFYTQ